MSILLPVSYRKTRFTLLAGSLMLVLFGGLSMLICGVCRWLRQLFERYRFH